MSTQPSKRPASTDRRVRSATARLTPEKDKSDSIEQLQQQQQQALKKEARERASSAKAIKDKHHGSKKLFPRPPSRSSRERFTSSYSKDFDGTFLPPAELRPTSPTRRNNPHPAKQFMVWRVPSREIGRPIEEGLEFPPEYMSQYSEFDAIDELGRSVDELKLPPPQPTSKEYGAYLRRLPPHGQQSEQYGMMARPQVVKPVTSELLGRTVKDTNMSALDEWLKTASPEEQHTVLKMLKSAEEAQVKDTIGQVMQPAAAMAVNDWLKNAEDKERDVAVRLFSSLGSRPGSRRPRSRSEPAVKFRPSSRQPVPPPLKELKHSPYDSAQGQKLRTRRLSAPPNRKQKPWPAGIWHHLPVRDPPPQVYNRGSLFGAVRGDASHYTVHPEWPDYQNSTFSSDVVH